MSRTKVGIRESRVNLASLESKTTVTVTRHGETLGVFVPGARPKPANPPRSTKPTRADIESLWQASAKMDAMIATMGATAEELIADFEKARREKRASLARL